MTHKKTVSRPSSRASRSAFLRLLRSRFQFSGNAGGFPALLARSNKERKQTEIIKKTFPFGLDIGFGAVKLVQFAADQHGEPHIAQLLFEAIPFKMQEDADERSRLLPKFLKTFLEKHGMKRECFVSAPSQLAHVELVRLPQLHPHEIESAVKWELKQTSFRDKDLHDYAFDYIVLNSDQSAFLNDRLGVMTIAYPKKELFEFLAVLQSCDLYAKAIDVEPFADAALVSCGKKEIDRQKVVMMINFGASKTTINIMAQDELVFTRALNISGRNLTNVISTYCKVSWDQAEAAKQAFGIAGEGRERFGDTSVLANDVRNSITPLLEDMVQDISHTFKYFSYQVAQSYIKDFHKIVLMGGGALLKGLVPFLQQRIPVDVEICNPLRVFGVFDSIQNDRVDASRFSIATGLAVRGVPQLT